MTFMQPKFVFFGTPLVASRTLERLLEAGYTPSLVVTSPDAPQGRGMTLTPSPVKALAESRGIKIATPEKARNTIDEVRATGAEYALVVAYGKILPQTLIDAFPLGVLNVHYSLLPKYRGASPVEAALLNGDTVTGVAVQRMVLALDAGDILAVKEEPIASDDTALTLRPRLIELGADTLIEALPAFVAGTALFTPQDETLATHCGKISKEARELDLSADAKENWNKYRAYAEGPGTHFFMERDGKRIRVKIKKASLRNGQFVVERVVPEGKNEMDFSALH
ncbi:MAG: methionyl-tRNA formyltransferase [Candidatus Pacebacteria bacterium]|nr:methionyl-tRNA formyltransferase [Candidatus Paceibacterota bacterium]MBP9840616.1 methionyl-tRNA formyltransferase [Candidatus Paceibacterota bacterium]